MVTDSIKIQIKICVYQCKSVDKFVNLYFQNSHFGNHKVSIVVPVSLIAKPTKNTPANYTVAKVLIDG